MRNLFFLLLISASSVWAKDVYSQGAQEMFSVKSGTIESIFKQIKKQSNYEFFYNTAILDVKQNVMLTSTSGTLDEILAQVLGKKYEYQVKDNYVLISERKVNAPDEVKKVTIKGVVKDKKGELLPGVSVLLKGTTIGVATDVKGEFTLVVPEQEEIVLLFTFIGMKMKEVEYKKQVKPIVVVLEENVNEMDEVVVTGYQEIKKTRMTGAVDVVTAAQIANKGYTSLEEVLKGTLAGVTTMSISGRPGAQAQIRIRGINSLTGNSDPIWIVDGMPMQGDLPSVSVGATDLQNTILTSGVGNIAPDDIESITILKDAAASAIYGARAANGVIVIKTKRGRVGKSYLNIQSTISVEEAPKCNLEMMNTQEKIAYERGIYEDFPQIASMGRVSRFLRDADAGKITRKEAEAGIEELSKINTNWYDELFSVVCNHNHHVSLSGGTEQTQFYASFNYQSSEGVMPNNKYNALGASLNLTHDFNKWLRIYVDLSSSVRNDQSSSSFINPLRYATFANTYERPYDDEGNYEYDRSWMPDMSMVKDGYEFDFNILKDMEENTSKTRYVSNSMSTKVELQLFKGFMYSFLVTLSNTSSHTKSMLAPGSYSSKYDSWLKTVYAESEVPDYLNRGSLTEATARSQSWTVRNQLEYARLFNDTHYVSLVFGQEASSSKSNSFTNYSPEYDPSKSIIGYPDVVNVSANLLGLSKLGSTGEGQDRSASFFISGIYTYKDRYVVAGSMRWDGADLIGTANRFSPLWNASFKWNLQEENFIRSLGFIDVLALRGSYGYTGSIDRNAYPFTLLTYGYTSYRYQNELVPSSVKPGNPSIKWQKKQDRSVGLDFSLFRNRINGTVNYYNNVTRDLLDTKRVPYSVGRGDVVANVASLRNSGWEISINTVNVVFGDFRWTTGFNIAFNDNKVEETFYKSIMDLPSELTVGYKQFVEGYPVNAYYGYKYAGVDPLTGHSLIYVNAVDEYGQQMGHIQDDGRYVIDADQMLPDEAKSYLGEAYPPISGGFNTDFTYKRLSLQASFSFMTGHKIGSFRNYGERSVYDANKNVFKDELNRWRKPGDITTVPELTLDYRAFETASMDSYIEDGSFLRCNYISLGYNVAPELCRKAYLTRARLSFNVHNVFTITKYSGIDPETMGAFGYPSARRYMLTLSLGI